ncbi:MAG: TIGR02302 family protein [Beijerinckiaceae bacterium]|nr:TIGR02302 family protein [Beijerinckiaceae bacterium]
MNEAPPPRRSGDNAPLDALIFRARLSELWERIWPALVALFVVVGLFVSISWLGLWLHTPGWGRALGLAALAGSLIWPILLLFRIKTPSRQESLLRIDRDSNLPHRPATTLDDALSNTQADDSTRALWRLHQRRAEQTAKLLKVAGPTPRTALQDRLAIRAAVLLSLVAAGFVAGPQKFARVASAFDFRAPTSAGIGYRLDAWIDPPPYTARPPLLLRGSAQELQAEIRRVEAPVGSTVVVRMSEGAGVIVEAQGGLSLAEEKDKKPEAAQQAARAGSTDIEMRWTLVTDGVLQMRRTSGALIVYNLAAIPDRAPIVTLRGEPRSNARGSLTLAYKLEDDYGIIGAEAEIVNPRVRGKPSPRSLVEPPRLPLGLPGGAGGTGEAETTTDLSEHGWAGARVNMTLVARDEGGNIGKSETIDLVLPQRPFVKPLARALVEQRRNLVLDPDNRARVTTSFEALTIAPEAFGVTAGQYLGLNTISHRLAAAKNDDDLRDVADFIWQMALQLEEGDLSQAERDLRAAQQALREALERGAPDDEIKRLMDQMRAALDRFLREFAEQQMREQDEAQDQNQPGPQDRTITSQDLQRMLDEMEKMARSGNMADAQRMLDQMQKLLENLKSARRSDQNQQSREMNRSLNQLDQMMRDQQELRDRTFQQGRKPQEGQESGDQKSLQQRQQALREQLEELQQRMRKFGMKPEQGFGDAEQAMRDAEQQLGRGQQGQGPAVDAQGRALEAMRQGAQSLAQQMQPGNQPGEQAGEGEGQPNGPGRTGRDMANPDPLGRESRDRGDNSRSTYDPAGVPAAQRAQRVLEELRRRLGDPARPRDELEYLERLLRRY